MPTFITGAGILVLSSIVLGLFSVFVRRQKIGYQGFLSGPGDLRISGAGVPVPDPAQIMADISKEEVKSTAALGAQISASIEETDFTGLGAARPIMRHVTTYLFGDDLYEESYPVESPARGSLGEVGVSLLESVTLGEAKNVVAIELWLFDMTDGSTSRKILVTPEASKNPKIRERLEPKGEVVAIEPDDLVSLDSASMRLRAKVVDLAVKQSPPVPGVFYERLILDIAVWESGETPLPIAIRDAQVEAEEPAGSESEGDVGGPAEVPQQQVRANYLVEYPERLFVRQTAKVRVTIPGGKKVKTRKKTEASERRRGEPGTLSFTHQLAQSHAEGEPDYPQVGIGLMFNPEEIYAPTTNQTVRLIPGEPLELEFLIKPLRAETVVMNVDFHHIGKSYVPEKQLEVTETKDTRTGEVIAVSTRTAPDRYTEAITQLGAETLSIHSVSFLGLGAGAFQALIYLIGLILSGTLVAWAALVVGFQFWNDIYVTAGGALLAMVLLWLIQRRGGGKGKPKR